MLLCEGGLLRQEKRPNATGGFERYAAPVRGTPAMGRDRRLDSLSSGAMCVEAAHLSLSSRLHPIGLPHLGAEYARGNRFAARGGAGRGGRAGCGRSWARFRPEPARARSTCGLQTVLGPIPTGTSTRSGDVRVADGPHPHSDRNQHAGGAPGASQTEKGPRRGEGPRSRVRMRYWMRVRQYGHTFQSALSGRWQVGQTLRTCVLQIGQTTKSRSMGAPHLGQMP